MDKAPLLSDAEAAEQLWINVPENTHYEDQAIPTTDPDADFDLKIRHWRPAVAGAIRGVVVIFHGLHSHSGRWARVAQLLVDAGFAVYANDHYSHGRSTANGLPVCDVKDLSLIHI